MSILLQNKATAFAATTNAEAAKTFYKSTLGSTFVEDGPYALVFDSNGIMLRAKGQGIYAAAVYGARLERR